MKTVNVLNKELFDILSDSNITCAEFAQAIKDVLNTEHYVCLKNEKLIYDKFIPITNIDVEVGNIYIGVPVIKRLDVYYIDLSGGYCVFDETAKCNFADIEKYAFHSYEAISPAMVLAIDVLIEKLQGKTVVTSGRLIKD